MEQVASDLSPGIEKTVVTGSSKILFPVRAATEAGKMVKQDLSEFGYLKKDDSGKERRYLAGLSSGMLEDHHGERMSEKCIDSFCKQFEEKSIPLYANHMKDFHDDIGIMTKSEKTDSNEWATEYRLYDEHDIENGIAQKNVEAANQIWMQATAKGPYTKRRRFGFSIEGYIAEGAVAFDENGQRVINDCDLDPGVSLVTRPAYKTSIAEAVFKSLDGADNKPTIIKKSILDEILDQGNTEAMFYDAWEAIEKAFDQALKQVWSIDDSESRAESLESVLDSYKDKCMSLFRTYNFRPPVEEDDNENEENMKTKAEKARQVALEKFAKSHGKNLKKMSDEEKELLMVAMDALGALVGSDESEEVAMMEPEEDETEKADDEESTEKADDEDEVEKEAEGSLESDLSDNHVDEIQPGVQPDAVKTVVAELLGVKSEDVTAMMKSHQAKKLTPAQKENQLLKKEILSQGKQLGQVTKSLNKLMALATGESAEITPATSEGLAVKSGEEATKTHAGISNVLASMQKSDAWGQKK